MSGIIDLTDEQKHEVDMALRRVLEICQIHKLPMFASVAIENNENDTKYDNIIYTGQAHNFLLKDDKIRKYMLIANGFDAVPPRENIEVDMDVLEEDEANV